MKHAHVLMQLMRLASFGRWRRNAKLLLPLLLRGMPGLAAQPASAPEAYAVLNLGVSSDNTRDLLARLDADVLGRNPRLVPVLVGTNDLVNSAKMLPLAEYEQNLQALVKAPAGGRRASCCSRPCPWTMLTCSAANAPALYHPTPSAAIKRGAAVVRRVARTRHVGFVDTHRLFARHHEAGRTANSWLRNEANAGRPDGVHPTAAGYAAIARRVAAYLWAQDLPTTSIVCLGDSITVGLHLPGAGTSGGDNYPAQRLLAAGPPDG